MMAAIALLLAGCALSPAYQPPATPEPAAWTLVPTAEGWVPAALGDTLAAGDWWTRFGDPVLDELAARVQVSNQTIALAAANYAQAQALLREQRAALFPSVGVGVSARRSDTLKRDGRDPIDAFAANLTAAWAPDLWGRIGEAVSSSRANVQASAADLAGVRLASIGSLAANYFALREADAEAALLAQSITAYERSLRIARNRYEAGIAAQTDVLQAQTQLVNAQAERLAVLRTRAVLEHAIAVLVGQAPQQFSVAPAEWKADVPPVPLDVPSTLLLRRPDIAAAERRVAAANAQIGVARSAYFPAFSLSASLGSNASRVADLFSAPTTLWSLGLSVAQVVFDAGAIGARVDGARAAQQASAARYRQTVLTAFQSVEDQLTASASLAQQLELRRVASAAADRAEQQQDNRYQAGQVRFTDVVTAQITALNARRAVLQVQLARQNAAVALVQALGGGWRAVDGVGVLEQDAPQN